MTFWETTASRARIAEGAGGRGGNAPRPFPFGYRAPGRRKGERRPEGRRREGSHRLPGQSSSSFEFDEELELEFELEFDEEFELELLFEFDEEFEFELLLELELLFELELEFELLLELEFELLLEFEVPRDFERSSSICFISIQNRPRLPSSAAAGWARTEVATKATVAAFMIGFIGLSFRCCRSLAGCM
jgi:hypothetical protein